MLRHAGPRRPTPWRERVRKAIEALTIEPRRGAVPGHAVGGDRHLKERNHLNAEALLRTADRYLYEPSARAATAPSRC